MESLENRLQPHSGVTPPFSMRTELQASLQSCRSVDADAWRKWALIVGSALHDILGVSNYEKSKTKTWVWSRVS